jgi:hypothetical protein
MEGLLVYKKCSISRLHIIYKLYQKYISIFRTSKQGYGFNIFSYIMAISFIGGGNWIATHTSLSSIWRGFAPGFVDYKKGCT